MKRGKKRRISRKAGLPPGTVVYDGEQRTDPPRITLFSYTEAEIEERTFPSVDQCLAALNPARINWINVDGLHDVDLIGKIGAHFTIHPLALEDIVHTTQRPKLDDYESYLFIIARMIDFDHQKNSISSEQVSFVLNGNTVLSFQENQGDVFNGVRERIRNARGRIRRMGSDYLLYALLDAIVDHYFVVIERLDERIEEIEDAILTEPTREVASTLHRLKREMITLRKSVWPLREVLGSLERIECSLITDETAVFMRDVYDHTIQIIDTVETLRDVLSGILEIYLSSVSHRLNEVMKVLTIISTIFMPLTFIAGIYGMNFKFMPELDWRFGYPLCLGIMAAIALVMLAFFRRRRWI